MNLPEPSGSSPPESRRAGTGSAGRMAFSRARGRPSRAGGGQVAHHHDLGSSPARRQARAESYSQLVPGNTGMATLGRAVLTCSTAGERLSQERGCAAGADSPPGGVYVLQHPLVEGEQLVNGGGVAADGDHRLGGGGAQPDRQGKSISSVSSATMERGQGCTSSCPHRNPWQSRSCCRRTCS